MRDSDPKLCFEPQGLVESGIPAADTTAEQVGHDKNSLTGEKRLGHRSILNLGRCSDQVSHSKRLNGTGPKEGSRCWLSSCSIYGTKLEVQTVCPL